MEGGSGLLLPSRVNSTHTHTQTPYRSVSHCGSHRDGHRSRRLSRVSHSRTRASQGFRKGGTCQPLKASTQGREGCGGAAKHSNSQNNIAALQTKAFFFCKRSGESLRRKAGCLKPLIILLTGGEKCVYIYSLISSRQGFGKKYNVITAKRKNAFIQVFRYGRSFSARKLRRICAY